MAFYGVTGLHNTLLSSAPLSRQAADLVCIVAFMAFAMLSVQRLWLLALRHRQNSRPRA